jgi:hypothetical protein
MTTILDIAHARVGDRDTITAAEMAAILDDLAGHGLQLDNGWGGKDGAGWAAMCDGITVISVLADDDAPVARALSSNPGAIRHDEPGSMHPQLRATLMFMPARLRETSRDCLEDRTRRLLMVEPAPGTPPAPPSKDRLECDNGHRWESDDPERDWACPTCGEGWV